MAVFCVSYDLNKAGQNYEALWAELKRTQYNHILDSTWLVSTTESVNQLRDRLRKHVDQNDHIFISKVNAGQYDGWMPQTVWDWITPRL